MRASAYGSVYTKRHSRCRDNYAMMLAILFSLKTMDLLDNGMHPYYWSDSIVFNENSIAGVMAELWQR